MAVIASGIATLLHEGGYWYEVILGLPHQTAPRTGKSVSALGYMCWS